MTEESKSREKKSPVKKQSRKQTKSEETTAKEEVVAEVKSEPAKKQTKQASKAVSKKIEVGSIVKSGLKTLKVLAIDDKGFADLCMVDKEHKKYTLSLRKLELVK